MTRRKVKLQYIIDDSSRKATFKKRKKGLIKKVNELSILCGVDACAIIYSAFEPQPEVWPSPTGAKTVLARFKEMSEVDQSKKMVNQESYLKQRIAKAVEKQNKEIKDIREMEITELMHQCLAGKSLDLSVIDWGDMALMADRNLKEIDKRLKSLADAEHVSRGKENASASGGGAPKEKASWSTGAAAFDEQMMVRLAGAWSSV